MGKSSASLSIWLGKRHGAVVAQMVTRLKDEMTVQAIGGPRDARPDKLARALTIKPYDDLRSMLIENPPAALLLTDQPTMPAAELLGLIPPGAIVLAMTPLTLTLDELAALSQKGEGRGAAAFELVPSFEFTPGWRRAAEPGEAIGPATALSFVSLGPPDGWSLDARLYDAWQTALAMAEMPVTVDATISGLEVDAPESLHEHTGHVTVHARMPHGGAVLMHLSDRAGRHERRLQAIGPQGRVRIDEFGYELFQLDGQLIDRVAPGRLPRHRMATLLAEHWVRRVARGATAPNQSRLEQVLACCRATMLSVRTGQPESPERMRRLAGR